MAEIGRKLGTGGAYAASIVNSNADVALYSAKVSGGDVLKMVVGQGMLLVVIGLALGLGAAFGLTRLMTTFLFGVGARDPLTFVSIAVVIGLIALLATIIPARRATKVDPMIALRYE